MKHPIIGVTPHYDYENSRVCIANNYLEAIRFGGGVPLLMPLMADTNELRTAANVCDGFLYTGGPDINPFRFGEETLRGCGAVYPERDRMEEELFHIAMENNKPVLGICRGIQVLNVFLGGTLYQDIDSQYTSDLLISHSQKSGRTVLSHSVIVEQNSLLFNILGKDYIQVNSFHHQAIKDIAPALQIAGISSDNLIEAVYHPNHKFFLAVQWHPEHLYAVNEDAAKVFIAFINACRHTD